MLSRENKLQGLGSSSAYFNIWGVNGPKLFAASVISVSGNTSQAGLFDCMPLFHFYHTSGSLPAAQVFSYLFSGVDANGSAHGAPTYQFDLVTTSSTNQLTSSIVVGVNDSLPQVRITSNSNIISPVNSAGILDVFHATVNTSIEVQQRFRFKHRISPTRAITILPAEPGRSFPRVVAFPHWIPRFVAKDPI